MKKLLWLVAVLAALALSACGGDEETEPAGKTGEEAAATAAPSLDLKTEGQITAGAEFPVKGFVELPISDPKGFEVDLAKAIAEELGVSRVKWINTPFSGLFLLASKKFDMAINEI